MSGATLDLELIEARANAATGGKWSCFLGSGEHQCTMIGADREDGRVDFIADVLPDYSLLHEHAIVPPANHLPNLHFFEHSRADVLALAEEVRRLRTALADYAGGDL